MKNDQRVIHDIYHVFPGYPLLFFCYSAVKVGKWFGRTHHAFDHNHMR